ncbi:hypothetical protein IQ251_16910 [Saccharopolyspora sp. HNM0983]|uniref:Uncharacterized protein n=1 Tax=Saccharopolyspora montiporae TaxID=2781240 RepID=A0A929G2S8_9PSEU|nr:hypothetical protein [Saccharopolyspora sp. HNM0983]MBE9376133.1 hypothetical protein [Saccharopolyspora sp. HNM0983]
MDSTPIYSELRKNLIDPEDTNWGTSSPPEFAAALTERAEQSTKTKADSKTKKGGRTAGRSRRHRAED